MKINLSMPKEKKRIGKRTRLSRQIKKHESGLNFRQTGHYINWSTEEMALGEVVLASGIC